MVSDIWGKNNNKLELFYFVIITRVNFDRLLIVIRAISKLADRKILSDKLYQ
ncbi:hypothetical protein SAMN02982990_01997 [Photorhabdus luminescens]|uniref:Uncharacterized protein n=1 Tax=Photorhabdus luminescens TaxID=29488 RepID=A0A1G5QMF5_PHOLU|nr:hypothetical protein SAMN02982990_01997 [Photorhabdus luminescens]